MKRVAVLGSPGAGKSTFCRKLAAKTGLPIIHLDIDFNKKPEYYFSHKEEWKQTVLGYINQDKWIMDGNYSSTFAERFERADVIIFLDVTRRKAFQGIIKRRIEYRNKKRPDMPEEWDEKIRPSFAKFVWDFHKAKNQQIKDELKKYPHKEVHVFKTHKQANEYLRSL